MALLQQESGVVLHGSEAWIAQGVTAAVGAVLGAVLGGVCRGVQLGGAAGVLVVLLLCAAPEVGTVLVRAPQGWGLGCLAAGLALAVLGRRWPHPAVLLLVLAVDGGLLAVQVAVPVQASPPGPPLLLVTLDTTRADSLDPWAAARTGRTPVLERFAAESVVYQEAHAPVALTGPAHAALFSGGDGVLTQVSRNGVAVPPDGDWFWTALRTAGWDTSGVVSAAVLDARLGFCRGLRRCDTAFSNRLRRGHPLLRGRGWRSRAGIAVQRSDERTAALAVHLWQSSRGTPALWVHLYGPHWPYTPSLAARRAEGLGPQASLPDRGLSGMDSGGWSKEETALGAALYRAQLRDLDAVLGELLATVGPDAAVVIVGDHGEGLGEHGDAFQHGRLPFAPASRVPLVVRCPGEAPHTVSAPVSTASVWSLVAPCLGLSSASTAPVRTRTWASEDVGGPLGPLAGLAVRGDGWTLAASRWHPVAAYFVATDPLEEHPLPADAAPAALQAAFGDAIPVEVQRGDEPVLSREALQALGYLEGVSGTDRGAVPRGL